MIFKFDKFTTLMRFYKTKNEYQNDINSNKVNPWSAYLHIIKEYYMKYWLTTGGGVGIVGLVVGGAVIGGVVIGTVGVFLSTMTGVDVRLTQKFAKSFATVPLTNEIFWNYQIIFNWIGFK